MSPKLAAPISITKLVEALFAFIMLRGIPISLLKFFIVLELPFKHCETMLVVDVFPLLPVIPTILPSKLLIIFFDIFFKAFIESGTYMIRLFLEFLNSFASVIISVAPFLIAVFTNLLPSKLLPLMAINNAFFLKVLVSIEMLFMGIFFFTEVPKNFDTSFELLINFIYHLMITKKNFFTRYLLSLLMSLSKYN